jgi:pre-mRNA cleavage complex 2 protein Pcf11
MIAEDYADSESSAGAIYGIIRQRLLKTTRENMLPLVYVLDSILKNVKGNYVNILEKDAIDWMPIVYQKLQDAQRAKLQKVWKTWNEFKLFSTENWKAIGRCFDDRSSVASIGLPTTISQVAGITRTVRFQFCML